MTDYDELARSGVWTCRRTTNEHKERMVLMDRIEAALAEAEDTNTPDDYRKLQRVIKALKGGK